MCIYVIYYCISTINPIVHRVEQTNLKPPLPSCKVHTRHLNEPGKCHRCFLDCRCTLWLHSDWTLQIYSCFTYSKWWFSTAILVYQRVYRRFIFTSRCSVFSGTVFGIPKKQILTVLQFHLIRLSSFSPHILYLITRHETQVDLALHAERMRNIMYTTLHTYTYK